MADYIDMHMHTTASDGLKEPSELLELVRKSEIKAFAVTDHDTFVGSAEIRSLLKSDDPELVTAVELSAGVPGEDLHMLVYLFSTDRVDSDSSLGRAVSEFQKRRDNRGSEMVERLQKKGLDISYELVLELANGSPVGRPHIADALLRSGSVDVYEQAFSKWIGYGKPGFVDKENIDPADAIRLAHDSGGIVILAHPGINRAEDEIERLVEYGLDGVEVLHPGNKQSQRKRYRALARANDLVISGGSDYHGRDDYHGEIGQMRVPYEFFESMKERSRRYNT